MEDPLEGLNPMVELALGAAGFATGVAIMLLGSGHTQQSRRFVETFGAKFWIGLIGLQTAYWAVVFGPLWRLLRRYRTQFRAHRTRVLAFAALFVVLLVASPYAARIPTFNPLAYHAGKIQVITLVGGLLIGIPTLMGISLIQLAGQRSFRERDPDEADVERFIHLREDLRRFLAIIGGVIALVTLATGALRKAMIANGLPGERFPPELVLLWGGMATALLLAAYVPTHLTLASAGRRLRDTFLPRVSPRDEGYVTRAAQRKTFEEDLQLQVTLAQRLQTGLLVLAPLTSALISLAFPSR